MGYLIKQARRLLDVYTLASILPTSVAKKLLGNKALQRATKSFLNTTRNVNAGKAFDPRMAELAKNYGRSRLITGEISKANFLKNFSKLDQQKFLRNSASTQNFLKSLRNERQFAFEDAGLNAKKLYEGLKTKYGPQQARKIWAETLRYGQRGTSDAAKTTLSGYYDADTLNKLTKWRKYYLNEMRPYEYKNVSKLFKQWHPVYKPHDYISNKFSRSQVQSLQKHLGLISKDDLLALAKNKNVRLDPQDLKHEFYITPTSAHNALQPNSILASSATPYTDIISFKPKKQALIYSDSIFQDNVARRIYNDPRTSRSIKKGLDIVRGQNVLQPGTRANKFLRRVQKQVPSLDAESKSSSMQLAEAGVNAYYNPRTNFLAVNPSMPHFDQVYKHEKGHFIDHNLPIRDHAKQMATMFGHLNQMQKRYGYNIPLSNTRLMSEAAAEWFRMTKLNGTSNRAFRLTYVQPKLRHAAVQKYRASSASDEMKYNLLNNLKKKLRKQRMGSQMMHANTKIPAVDKEMLDQLAFNYDHAVFN
jgi:hypothetical protein